MDNKDAALKAIEEWNQGSIDDRIIQIKESKFKNKNKKPHIIQYKALK